MQRIGVIGIGDMGSGLALNLIRNGFETHGHDYDEVRLNSFAAMGGVPAASSADVGLHADVVFVMVMTGAQARNAILGDGLVSTLRPGSVVVLSATVRPEDARDISDSLAAAGIGFVDAPVSGGFPGAQAGTLTAMAAGSETSLETARPAMEAVCSTIHVVGNEAGMGQVVKACLQSLIGSIFTATFEATALAAKAGISGQVLYDVFSTSVAGCPATNTAVSNIIDRQFEGTGSHIRTMYKDLSIALDMARTLGVPLFTASTAMQLFQAGKTRYPDGDNWIITRLVEDIVDARLNR